MATIDDVYALLQSVDAKVDTLTTTVNTINTNLNTANSKINTIDSKVDLLSGDTTGTNVLDRVISLDRRVRTIEFKIMKGK